MSGPNIQQIHARGCSYTTRLATPEDGPAAFSFFRRIRAQSPFLLMKPTEGVPDAITQSRQLSQMQTNSRQAIFFAFSQDDIVAFVGLTRGSFYRNCHVASLAIAVDLAHQRKGIGGVLMRNAVAWAKKEHVRRLELTVAAENAAAIALYAAHGFIQEGTKRESFLLGTSLADELIMSKLIELDGV